LARKGTGTTTPPGASRGTDGSNLVPSSGESGNQIIGANLDGLDRGAVHRMLEACFFRFFQIY
jgi:hypothetical protein